MIEVDAAALLEDRLELFPAALDAALHAGKGHAGARGSLRLVDPLEIGQRDCLSIRSRQLAHHRRQADGQLLQGGSFVLFGSVAVDPIGLGKVRRAAAGKFVPAVWGAVVVDDDVPRRAVYPGMQARRIAQRPEAFDDLEQHALHQIVDVGLVPDTPADEGPEVAMKLLPRRIECAVLFHAGLAASINADATKCSAPLPGIHSPMTERL